MGMLKKKDIENGKYTIHCENPSMTTLGNSMEVSYETLEFINSKNMKYTSSIINSRSNRTTKVRTYA